MCLLTCLFALTSIAAAAPVADDVLADAPADDDARALERRGIDARDVALAVPRAVLFPARVTLQALFAPIRYGLKNFGSGSGNLPLPLYLDRKRRVGITPTLALQPGLRPVVGAKVSVSGFGNDERLEIAGGFGGRNLFNVGAQFGADNLGGGPIFLRSGVKYERINTLFFSGVGSKGGLGAQYSQRRFLAMASGGLSFGNDEQMQLGMSAIGNARRFGDPTREPETSVRKFYDTEKDLVGFDEGAVTVETDVVFTFRGPRVSGIREIGPRLELFGGPVWSSLGGIFVHAGAEASWTIDLYGGNRLLTLRGFVDSVEGPDEIIPFTSLPRLGGINRVRGYRQGRFRDKRAMGATVEYRYPIHEWVQSVLFLDVGTVAQEWRDVPSGRFHPGGGVGFLLGSSDSVVFRTDIAYGDGFAVTIATDVPLAFNGREEEL